MLSSIAIAAIVSWIVLGMLFLGYPTVKRLKDGDYGFGWIVKVPIYVALVLGLTADVVFNATWGTWIFREPPREWTFTARLKRHWRGNSQRQKDRAEPWVRRVNAVDPGHV